MATMVDVGRIKANSRTSKLIEDNDTCIKPLSTA